MIKLAFRNVFRNRARTALTLIAIMSGVCTVIISGGFIEDIFVQLRESTIHSRLGHIQVFRHGYLEYGRRDPSKYLIDHVQNLRDIVQNIPHVKEVMARINFSGSSNTGP